MSSNFACLPFHTEGLPKWIFWGRNSFSSNKAREEKREGRAASNAGRRPIDKREREREKKHQRKCISSARIIMQEDPLLLFGICVKRRRRQSGKKSLQGVRNKGGTVENVCPFIALLFISFLQCNKVATMYLQHPFIKLDSQVSWQLQWIAAAL